MFSIGIDFLGPLKLHRYTSHILGYNSQAIKISLITSSIRAVGYTIPYYCSNMLHQYLVYNIDFR